MNGAAGDTSGHDAAWLEMKRRDIATKAMVAILGNICSTEALNELAAATGTDVHDALAWRSFSIADAMMTEAMRPPEMRAAQREMWQRGSKGGDA